MTQNLNQSAPVTIDARGPRFTAGITFVDLSLSLLTHSTYLIGFQMLVFAIAAFTAALNSGSFFGTMMAIGSVARTSPTIL